MLHETPPPEKKGAKPARESYTARERAFRRASAHLMAKFGGPSNPGTRLQNAHGGPPTIPDKLYFRIGEVASLCRVPTYVLRFWQTEFPQLRPGKSGTGQRLYRRRDLDMALHIKRLLHEEGYTIAGAKSVLNAESSLPPSLRQPLEPPSTNTDAARAQLLQVRAELRELLALLNRPPPSRPNPGLLLHRGPRQPEE